MKEESEKIVATFLMASDHHSLAEVYSAFVIESGNHCPVLSFGSLKSMRTEKFHLPHPFSRQTPCPVVVPCHGSWGIGHESHQLYPSPRLNSN
jgi:poly(3-hydroxybutyrate) depolymerase